MSEGLQGQVALVTGASRGIGRVIAERLARAGVLVLINYLQQQTAAEETLTSICAAGGRAELCRFDVAHGAEVTTAIQNSGDRHGRIDILANNAGLALDNRLLSLKAGEWEPGRKVKLKGGFLCTKAE